MPQANRKQGSASRAPSKSSSRSAGKKPTAGRKKKQPAAVPIRREIGGAVCFFLALLELISYFQPEALFIRFLRDFTRGLLGAGYYFSAPLLLLASFGLVFHHGRPVTARTVCTLLTMVAIGAFWHVVACSQDYDWSFQMLPRLYLDGAAGKSGGLVAGFAAQLCAAVISPVGAGILFFVAGLLLLLRGLNMTVGSIVRAIQERPRAEYPEEEPKSDPAKKIVNHVAQKQIDRQERRRIAAYDLPVDDPPAPVQPEQPSATPARESPVAFLEQQRQAARPAAAQTSEPVPATPAASAESADSRIPTRVRPQRKKDKPLPDALPSSAGMPEEHGSSMIGEVDAFLADIQPSAAPAAPEPSAEAVAAAKEAISAVDKVSASEAKKAAIDVALEIDSAAQTQEEYRFPPTSLLLQDKGAAIDGTEEMRLNVERLNATLKSFSIDAHIVNVIRGPSVTRYEVELDAGVKLSKLTNLSDDIALALGATGVRIAAIPDKISVVGIEVPNKQVSTVYIREVIESNSFVRHKSNICFAVGKDIGGKCIVGDISRLPHMLIAGTTGSGKSVCTNSLIISLLYKSRPEDVRLIMVDPKMVELGVYNGIPHLLIPVVTDPKKAAGALQWAVTEMMRRYKTMADAKVREIDEYNRKVAATDPSQKLPRIVVVIDELADLMLVAAKEVEESICRVAQMGRAAGMHLIIATQRPSADVITGLMKANIPSRIAFAVASSLESRIILDTPGAEKLVGKGDMLYAPLGTGKPQRVQGCFITDGEVQSVVDYIKNGAEASYSTEVMEQIDRQSEQQGKGSAASGGADELESAHDEMLPAAVEVILETKQASVSMLQRRLKLGYARAARIVDEMEEMGIVGPFEGSKPRQLLITREQWQQMQGNAPAAIPAEGEAPPWDEESPEEESE